MPLTKQTIRRTSGDFVLESDLNTSQMQRARRLHIDVQDGPMTAACEIIALRDALVAAVALKQHARNCAFFQPFNTEAECSCGWYKVVSLAHKIEQQTGTKA